VHGTQPFCRAVDLECDSQTVAEFIAQAVNEVWQYDFKRPEKQVAIAHYQFPEKKEGMHIHCQVHPNTREKF
jgi:hypothetical protein